MPEFDDRALFEKFVLDGFQAGLSWITILRKRENFRKAFDHFEPAKIARYKPAKLAALMQNEGIIRNRAKIEGAVASAQAYLALQEGDGFSHYLWNFVDGAPIQNKFRGHEQIPAETPLSLKISKDLKQRGFKFCGPTIVYAFMQAVGMVNDHVVPCWRHEACAALRRVPGQGPLTWPRRAPGSACFSGKRLDLLNPTPFDWEDEDLAVGLARTYRWGGHSAWPLPLSVAQHSLFVLQLRRLRSPEAKDARADLRELLHDADEGLLGFDSISPLKPFLGEAYHQLVERLQNAICVRYGLPAWTVKEKRVHKEADRTAAATEAVRVVGWTEEEVQRVLRIPYEPLTKDPLQPLYGGTAFEPWPPQVAAERFLTELRALIQMSSEPSRKKHEKSLT